MTHDEFVKSFSCECLHKVQVVNPGTGELQLVPCGTCPACIYRKSVRSELKVKSNVSSFKYCYFVSLTYNVYNCPSCTITTRPFGCNDLICTVSYDHHRETFLSSGHALAFRGYSKRGFDPFTFVCS